MKLKATGEAVELPHELEELATWWAEVEVTEFGEKDKVKENFWLDFGSKLDAVGDFYWLFTLELTKQCSFFFLFSEIWNQKFGGIGFRGYQKASRESEGGKEESTKRSEEERE